MGQDCRFLRNSAYGISPDGKSQMAKLVFRSALRMMDAARCGVTQRLITAQLDSKAAR
jgi:hypothetical protein